MFEIRNKRQTNIRIIFHSDSDSRKQLLKKIMIELMELETKGEKLAEEVRRELLQDIGSDFPPIAKALEVEMNQAKINKLKTILDRLSGEK